MIRSAAVAFSMQKASKKLQGPWPRPGAVVRVSSGS
jgi:hypothetical protein